MSDAAPIDVSSPRFTAFEGQRRLISGSLQEVALAVKRRAASPASSASGPVLIFDDSSGRTIDFDPRGSDAQMLARLAPTDVAAQPRGRGRPRLGVVAREVTLLPRHWQWLGTQAGGASVALRRLVEEASRASRAKDDMRRRQDTAYRFMVAIAGDQPGFEEAARALFAADQPRLLAEIARWPSDVREHLVALAYP
ncbi:MAG TPA: DUF2239 family protein [Steroidobacteraceae bacterium]|nr:DUF2239 family protein [Steroidobacteraceae bacterium]